MIAAAAVLAVVRRRFVVVEIINWPVSFSLLQRVEARQSEIPASNLIGSARLYKVSPPLQTAVRPLERHFWPGVASVSRAAAAEVLNRD